MPIKAALKRLFELTGYRLQKIDPTVYDQDGLRSIHNHDFMTDSAFNAAYQRGIKATRQDYYWHWRVYIGLWAAFSATKLEGDFIECGVNRGFMSSAVMQFLNWDTLGKTFYLLDTFAGLDARLLSEAELKSGALKKNEAMLKSGFYVSGIDSVKINFAEWVNVRIIPGTIPETLVNVDAQKIAYLHLDLNSSLPEVAAIKFFWHRLVPGAYILMDDYAYQGWHNSKLGMDSFAQEQGVMIASLPTGQGLLIKPPLKDK